MPNTPFILRSRRRRLIIELAPFFSLVGVATSSAGLNYIRLGNIGVFAKTEPDFNKLASHAPVFWTIYPLIGQKKLKEPRGKRLGDPLNGLYIRSGFPFGMLV